MFWVFCFFLGFGYNYETVAKLLRAIKKWARPDDDMAKDVARKNVLEEHQASIVELDGREPDESAGWSLIDISVRVNGPGLKRHSIQRERDTLPLWVANDRAWIGLISIAPNVVQHLVGNQLAKLRKLPSAELGGWKPNDGSGGRIDNATDVAEVSPESRRNLAVDDVSHSLIGRGLFVCVVWVFINWVILPKKKSFFFQL